MANMSKYVVEYTLEADMQLCKEILSKLCMYKASPYHVDLIATIYDIWITLYQGNYSFQLSMMSFLLCSLTHLPLDKMAAISQLIFYDAFSWLKTFKFWLEFHCS